MSAAADVATLARNAVHLLPERGLEEKLRLGRPLRVKFGIDVTSPDIHVGRAIPLQRMRAFQDAGHVGVLIIGDYTTRIGDPSGRSAERPILDPEEIDRNAQTYLEQALLILDRDRTEVRFNGEWLAKLDFADVLRLTRTTTVAQILERAHRSAEAQQPLRRHHDERARRRIERLAAEQMEGLRGGRRVDDPNVLLRGELKEPLETRARVLGAVPLVPVREEQRQPRRLAPLRKAGDDELVDRDLRAVDEVTELRLPEHERLRCGDRVAVLEADSCVFGERRVEHLERRAPFAQVLDRRIDAAVLRVVQDDVPM